MGRAKCRFPRLRDPLFFDSLMDVSTSEMTDAVEETSESLKGLGLFG